MMYLRSAEGMKHALFNKPIATGNTLICKYVIFKPAEDINMYEVPRKHFFRITRKYRRNMFSRNIMTEWPMSDHEAWTSDYTGIVEDTAESKELTFYKRVIIVTTSTL